MWPEQDSNLGSPDLKSGALLNHSSMLLALVLHILCSKLFWSGFVFLNVGSLYLVLSVKLFSDIALS